MTDNEIAGLLIGLLMAGQHTSSTTSSWLGFYIAQDKEYQVREFINYSHLFIRFSM